MDFDRNYDIDKLYEAIKDCRDVDYAINAFNELKSSDNRRYLEYLEKMKVLFIVSSDYSYLSTAALIFSELKIHSAVPLIIAKLLSGKFDDNGGTFLFCLIPLRKKFFYMELESLWSRKISWEMKQKLILMGIEEP